MDDDEEEEEKLLKKEPNLRQNPSNINELVQYLGTSLRNDQLQSILASVLALGIDYELLPEGDRHFPNLFHSLTNLLADEAESYLRLMLESVQYDMSGLEWLPPAPVLNVNSSDRNRKLDMLLTMGVTVTSLSEDDYTRFKRHLIENNVLHGYTEDTIESPCHLVKLLFERGHLVTDNLKNVFDWLIDSDCSYPKQLRRYCDRYDVEAPRERCWKSVACSS
uniref:Uncharacterized protein n=1 Tax=Amphimedon queenslandica TaxID=400682 RepID=A0A1X7SI73_AMPQE